MTKPIVLVVEDDAYLREALSDTLNLAGFTSVAVAEGGEALKQISEIKPDLVLSDIQMRPMDGQQLLRNIRAQAPALPVVMMTAFGSVQQAVEAMQSGANDYLMKPFEPEVLVSKIQQYLPISRDRHAGIIADDNATRQLFELAKRVAQSEATVMIAGPSGSGKEVLARFIHDHSARAAAPFVAINCAAIPDNMLEATLFGYEKGAFTGAYAACPGKFEQAQHGTLLLDEISEMDLALQAKLLRVLQEREVERLGGRKMIALDVRVLATSNRVLRQEVAAGRFREDLFYRLNVFPITVPPLRERKDDIIPLAYFFAERIAFASDGGKPRINPAAAARLRGYSWPGNVRELANVMQRAMIMSNRAEITAESLQFESDDPVVAHAPSTSSIVSAIEEAGDSLGDDLRSHEQRLILEALNEGRGSRQFAAQKLGISARTLRYKLARLRDAGIDVPG